MWRALSPQILTARFLAGRHIYLRAKKVPSWPSGRQHACLRTKFWVRRTILAVVWGLALSTWASIAHYLGGLPDVGPALVLTAMIFIMVRPARRISLLHGRSTTGDGPMQVSAPTV
jgi:hypothetical protein